MNNDSFSLSECSAVALWEARHADKDHWQIVEHPRAGGGAYVEPCPDAQQATLTLRFTTDRPVCIKVFPSWWRHGEQKAATRFPYNLPQFTVPQVFAMAHPDPMSITRLPFSITQRSGPEVVDYINDTLFFTAPDAGRIGVVDLPTEQLTDVIEVGGFLADLVCDRVNDHIYVADGKGDRIVVLDAKTRRVETEVSVPEFPCSLALGTDRLFVACMEARELVAIDLSSLKIIARVSLPLAPQHVEVRDGEVVVWMLPDACDPLTFDELPPDRLCYFPTHPFPAGPVSPPLPWQSLRAFKPGQAARLVPRVENYEEFHVQPATAFVGPGSSPNSLSVRWLAPEPTEAVLDISEIIGKPERQDLPAELRDDSSPDRYCVAAETCFFTSPSSGKIGYFPLKPCEQIDVIEVGGYLADMVAFNGDVLGKYLDRCLSFFPSPDAGKHYSPDPNIPPPKVYVADALGNRVVVIDPQTRRVVKEISVSDMPINLCLYGLDLFVTCRKGQEIIVIDLRTDEIVRRHALPAEPLYADVVKLQPPHTASEFRPRPAVDESPLRLIVHYKPLAFDALILQPTEGLVPQADAALAETILYQRRTKVHWLSSDGINKEVFADNMHTVRFDRERWLDVSAVTVAQAGSLHHRDTPGTVTLSLDGGPEHDWMRSIWVTPGTRSFLENDTEEFREWNAPTFHIEPGQHELRVTAHSPCAQMDGLLVWRSLEDRLNVKLHAEPLHLHEDIALPSYQGVFASDEPVQFTLEITNRDESPQSLEIDWKVVHPVDDECLHAGQEKVVVGAGDTVTVSLCPEAETTGLLALEVTLRSEDGRISLRRHLLRLPELRHPRLLFGVDDMPAIQDRIHRYPELFRRYREWMEFRYQDSRFLPPNYNTFGQDMTIDLAKWRAIACMFTEVCVPSPDGRRPFFDRLRQDLQGAAHGGWSAFQADFQFGAALAILYDLACALDPDMQATMREQLAGSLLHGRALPEALAQIEVPLTPQTRTVLGWHAIELANYIRYFRAHAGTMGGMLWQGLRSDCQCSLHSMGRTFILWSNFLRDRKLVEAQFWSGFYTHQNYAMPRIDHERFLSHGGVRGGGEHPPLANAPMRLAMTSICRHPLEKARNDLDRMITKLNGPPGYDEDRSARSTLATEANVVVPLFLGLGWYDPDAPVVEWEELPPSILFDVEGAACLKSDWSGNMTEIYFVSGVCDVSYRTQPNHLQIFKAGRVLFGTPVHTHDHGTPTPSWGNSVVIGEGTPHDWEYATGYERMDERSVIRRFAPESLGYIARDARISGVVPQSYHWFTGGHSGPGMYDLVLHSHTWHPFLEQGKIVAYETSPEFDYVAGDATNVWSLKDAREVYRQIVFFRSDVTIVFDRITLGSDHPPTRWVASTAPDLVINDNTFLITNGNAYLHGTVLLPEPAAIRATGARCVGLRQEGGDLYQNTLEIVPANHSPNPRYLTVLRTGTGKVEPLNPERFEEYEYVGVRFDYEGKTITVRFLTSGPIGGRVTIASQSGTIDRNLNEAVNLSLRHWENDPRYGKWVTEPRFRCFVSPGDLR